MALWFTISVLSRADSDYPPADGNLWEEDLYLIEAENSGDAKVCAERLARQNEVCYTSATGDAISWRFDRVLQVYQMDGVPQSGAELLSRFYSEAEVEILMQAYGDQEEGNKKGAT